MNKDEINKKYRKNKIILFALVLLTALLLIVWIITAKIQIKTEKVNLEEISKTDEYVSEQIDLLPENLYKSKIELSDKIRVNSTELFKNNNRSKYTVDIIKNNNIYSYNFQFDEKLKINNSYKLFSTVGKNMEISNYFESSDGYILIIKKNIEYANHEEYSDIKRNDLEIQKYDKNDNLKWTYEINADESSIVEVNYFTEKNNNHIFTIYGGYSDSLLVLDKEGKKIKEIDLNLLKVDGTIWKMSDDIYFETPDRLVCFNTDTLEEYFIDSLNVDDSSVNIAYLNENLYSYIPTKYNVEKDKYEKSKIFEKEKYNILFKINGTNKKETNIINDYDKLYKFKPYTYMIDDKVIFNNNYIYVPINKVDYHKEFPILFMAIMIYDKDLNLVNIINTSKIRYLVGNQTKEKFEELQKIFVSNDNLYLYGKTTENTIIESYNREGKNKKTHIFYEPNILLDYKGGYADIISINNNSYLFYDNYYYNDINYLKVTNYKFK